MALFQVYTQVQSVLQESIEQRVQASLHNSRNETAASM